MGKAYQNLTKTNHNIVQIMYMNIGVYCTYDKEP